MNVSKLFTGFVVGGAAALTIANVFVNQSNSAQEHKSNLIENPANTKLTSGEKIITWEKALDSLKTDSLCKKAYIEGSQMVKDSVTHCKLKR